MNKTNKFFLFFLIILIIPTTIILAVFYNPQSPFSTQSIYISGNDVIKNFRIESFDDEIITSGGTVPSKASKLKFESSAFWTAFQDDITIITAYQDGDKVYLYYKIAMSTEIQAYTNVRLPDAIPNGKNLDVIQERLLTGAFWHYGLYGGLPLDSWSSHYTWRHYDFGSIRTHNGANNMFSGDLKMSFDINPSPLPDIFSDPNGNSITPQFDYIGIDAIYVGDRYHGSLSEGEIPEVVSLTPSEFRTTEGNEQVSGGNREGSTLGYNYRWNPNEVQSESRLLESVDFGIQAQSTGASLQARQKNGDPLWDSKNREESMTSCEFTYNIGSLSPIIQRYGATLTYNQQELIIKDDIKYTFPLGFELIYTVFRDTNRPVSYTRDTALHITNRYIYFKPVVIFNVWTSLQIEGLDDEYYQSLENPEEWYDQIAWQSAVDGMSGATQYQEGWETDASGWFWVIIIIAVIFGGAYLFIQLAPFILLFVRNDKKK